MLPNTSPPSSPFQQFLNANQPKDYHLFISHSWNYGSDRDNLIDMIIPHLNAKQVWDYAAPKDHPIHALGDRELAAAINERLKQSRVFVVPAGVYATFSKWIKIELALAKQLGLPVVAIRLHGAERTSQLVVNNANEYVNWSGKSVADAIKKWHP